jgi:hypothetical protein
MPNIPSVAIDPYLVWLPKPCYSAEQLETFIEGLLAWAEALRRRDVDIFISERCIGALYDDGWYPYDGRITPLLKKYHVDNAHEEDIVNVVRLILDRTPRLEERVGVSEIYCNEASTIIAPDYFLTRLGTNTAVALRESLVMLGFGKQYLLTLVNGCLFASTPRGDKENHSELSVIARVEIVEINPDVPNTFTGSEFPLDVDESFQVCFGHADLLHQVSVLDLWDGASSEAGAYDAINARIAEHQRAGLPEGQTAGEYTQGLQTRNGVSPFRLGPKFLESARHHDFGTRTDWAANLIDSCARIALQIPKQPVEAFRTDDRAQALQRTRKDGARGWRTHLTKAHEGFRLMFWTTFDGVIEFANVGPKRELEIC